MKYRFLLLISIATLTLSCNKKDSKTSASTKAEVLELQYAKGFQVEVTDQYTHITIRNPWDTVAILNSYILVDRAKDLPSNLPKGSIIRTPVQSVVATSTLQCSILNELNSVELVKGVCEPEYIKNPYVVQGVADGTIINLGMAHSPSLEDIIMLSPDIVLSDPIIGKNQANLEKAKVPLVLPTSYTEPHPLGRAEWIRFYALFLDAERQALADSLFSVTVDSYNAVKEKMAEVTHRPTVLTDTRYQGNWTLPGGNSNAATLFRDAGAAYIWADDQSNMSMTIAFESVLDKAGDADKWIIRYFDDKTMTYESLQNEFKPYSYFKAFKDKEIYTCNTKFATYYDDLPIHPDWVLKDLANVFHPEMFPDYQPRYYTRMVK